VYVCVFACTCGGIPICVTWHYHMCDMKYSYVWRGTRLSNTHTNAFSHFYLWNLFAFPHMKWFHGWDMKYSWVQHGVFIYETRLCLIIHVNNAHIGNAHIGYFHSFPRMTVSTKNLRPRNPPNRETHIPRYLAVQLQIEIKFWIKIVCPRNPILPVFWKPDVRRAISNGTCPRDLQSLTARLHTATSTHRAYLHTATTTHSAYLHRGHETQRRLHTATSTYSDIYIQRLHTAHHETQGIQLHHETRLHTAHLETQGRVYIPCLHTAHLETQGRVMQTQTSDIRSHA